MNSDPAQESSAANPEGPIKLTPGQSAIVTIEAKRRNNWTNVCFESEAVYDLSATGKWCDAGREEGPEGYPGGTFCRTWYAGCVGRQTATGWLCWESHKLGRGRSLLEHKPLTKLGKRVN